MIDITISVALLVVALLPCVVAMVLIRIESAGSPLFIQRRVGRGGQIFLLLKLRTMARDAGDHPSHEISATQITKMGAFLRRTKLDELPQLINVLAGSMSLVGPRPCLPTQSALIAERVRRGLYAFRPGITGPAQVLGIDMSDPGLLARTEADYFRRATLWQDMALIVRTAIGSGRGDAARRGF